ncbi:guanine nucleotide-releasing factor 2 isoform X5 [Anoplophora glabripennis]|uniref:guanine nucleotide-releasing factor 2 isoform X5 n=1 Tax=Anoplophora glabripennis TaxID=217634 RepID=UPI000C76AE6C|nr:guanine nucleotide-releasing factor 2 isoform X5 [Anoplophora glabripennis]
MPDYDELISEPGSRRRKYRVYGGSQTWDFRKYRRKYWTVLLSVSPLEDVLENETSTPSPLAGSGPGGHKASFKSTKLARRARSFKDDFLGKISQMRSPTGPGLRSHSPKGSQSPKPDMVDHAYITSKGPIQELDDFWKQIQIALKHFRDVVSKQKLEMLPGNGTIVLDTVWAINLSVKSSVSADSSSSIKSAICRMYQSVARLIKLCDDVLIDDKSDELDKENVNEIVAQVEDAVKDLINLAQEKISHQQITYKTTPRSTYGNSSLEMPAQRNSLPDIPLTPRERQILEQTSCVTPSMVRSSHSTESILRDSSPPPKPPLPENVCRSDPSSCVTPPPLPPKKKSFRAHPFMDEGFSVDHSPIASSLERVSMRSKSPEDSISLLSESAGSVDSMLNHSSREEDEIKALMDGDSDMMLDNHTTDIFGELLITCERHQSHQSLSSSTSIASTLEQDGCRPPPLPPKKKHMFQSVAYSVMAYMEMFGNCSHTNDQEFMRHSVHMVQSQWAQPLASGLPTTQSCSFSHSSHSSRSSHTHIQTLALPPHSSLDQRIPSPLHSPNSIISSSSSNSSVPPALPPKQRSRKSSAKSPPPTPTGPVITEVKPSSPVIKALPDLLEHTALPKNEEKSDGGDISPSCEEDLMEMLSVDQFLLLKKPEEDGPDIRGGPIDALIIQATKATKNGVFMYQEAFLTTYRTFISPYELITKLIRRYNHFYYQPDKKPRSREAFALIVRVVSDLTSLDLDEELQLKLMNFVQQLISCGELTLAKALRVKHLQRHEAKQMSMKYTNIVTSLSLSARNFTLLDFKSEQIAEQMTLLDAELFMKIEIPEVLIWAQEQNEERSPNLTRFTEHFNKMSYWARTKILTAEGKDIREKYFMKFIKIMKHLRKINNFNSYLALLSALDSAPVRRLEWQKHVQEGLKEYCALIDSSSSFRAYRMALAETQPPCIPYIGLVLQDLTFVHIGNSNLLPNGAINFSKRWQQFNIVENMKKFKKATYTFKRQEKIINFFQNFDDCIGEDAMWKLSEKIKPRGGKKTAQ